MVDSSVARPTDVVGKNRWPLLRLRRIFVLAVPVVLIAGVSVERARGKPISRPLSVNQQLLQAETSSRLVMQQLDEVFDNLAASIRARGELTEQDAALLRCWKDYDEQFLVSTRDNPSLRYMRANARFRLGLIHQFLGEHEAAVSEFQKAAHMLEVLVVESPDVGAYQEELFFCWLNAGENALKTGDKVFASECAAEMGALIYQPGLTQTADWNVYQSMLQSLANRIAARP